MIAETVICQWKVIQEKNPQESKRILQRRDSRNEIKLRIDRAGPIRKNPITIS